MTPEGYRLCELENSNLRKALMWAARQLPPDKVGELRAMIDHPLSEGGVTTDGAAEEENDMKALMQRAAVLLREAIASPTIVRLERNNWFFRAEDMASKLSEYEMDPINATLPLIKEVNRG